MNFLRRALLARLAGSLAAALLIVNADATELAAAHKQLEQPSNEVVEFLLSTASNEFKRPGPLKAVGFREVRVGYFSDTAPGRYVLCGSVQSSGVQKTEWIRFSTIQTSPYEQWLGGVAESICASKKVKWYSGDFSAELLKRVRG
jgi:hypothetical protein